MPTRTPIRPASGFTVVEILVTLAIIAVLVAMLLPAISKTRARVLQLRCGAQLRGVGLATFIYADDFKGAFPVTSNSTTISLSGIPQPAIDRDVKSMTAFFPYLNYNYGDMFCPDAAGYGTAIGYDQLLQPWYRRSFNGKASPLLSSSNPGANFAGAYLKYVGTMKFWNSLGSRYNNCTRGAFYDDLETYNTSNPSVNYHYSGYLTLSEMQGGRRQVPTNFPAQGPSGGLQSPTKITMYSDLYMFRQLGGNGLWYGASHFGRTNPPSQPTNPGYPTGINEVLADGHVIWTDSTAIGWVPNDAANSIFLLIQTDLER